MFRIIAYLLISILLISIVRGVVGVIMKAMGELLKPPAAGAERASTIPLSSELRKDPVCGVYVPTNTAFHKTVHGETVFFCSETCQKKYAG